MWCGLAGILSGIFLSKEYFLHSSQFFNFKVLAKFLASSKGKNLLLKSACLKVPSQSPHPSQCPCFKYALAGSYRFKVIEIEVFKLI